jgi:hypothetical protein
MLISKKKLQLALAAIAAAFILALHWGISEYASVQFAGFAVAAGACVGSLLRNRIRALILSAAGISVVVICALAASHETQLILKGVRSVVVLTVLLAVRFGRLNHARIDWSEVAANGIYGACVASGALACLQLLDSFFWGGGLFDIPLDWYSLDYGTVMTERRQELLGSTYFIRPSATFSEPSALAVLGLITLAVAHQRGNLFMQVFGVFTALVSCSLLGMVFTALWLVWQSFQRGSHLLHRFAIAGIAVGLMTAFFTSEALSARIATLLSGDDVSARIRLAEPFRVITFALQDGRYLGVNDSYARFLMSSDVTTVFSNWALNQVIYYGLLAPLIISLPLLLLGQRLWFILAVFMVANGDALYYDRFCLLVMAILALGLVVQRPEKTL